MPVAEGALSSSVGESLSAYRRVRVRWSARKDLDFDKEQPAVLLLGGTGLVLLGVGALLCLISAAT
ncbi:hypothetical protein [Streptomyces sp. NPDC058202]|uniref:hypothetical protein n=1 Tax=Streptomyces sp. NPDC058202 TaxID=3346380 RepID=UPI0036E32163